jgi:hypothetical protein
MSQLMITSSRDRIPKDMSFPVKFSMLECALKLAGLDIEVSINFRNSKREFDVYFWPPNANVHHERLYIVIGTVPSIHAQAARALVTGQIVPEMISWLEGILALPHQSPRRRSQQVFMRGIIQQLAIGTN